MLWTREEIDAITRKIIAEPLILFKKFMYPFTVFRHLYVVFGAARSACLGQLCR
jgi:hypothetical protein